MLANFRRRKLKEKEANQAKGRGGENEERMMPIMDSRIVTTEAEPQEVDKIPSQGSAKAMPMTRRRFYDVTENLIQQQLDASKRRRLEGLNREGNKEVQGDQVERSKLRASSAPISSSKKPKSKMRMPQSSRLHRQALVLLQKNLALIRSMPRLRGYLVSGSSIIVGAVAC